MNKSKIIIFIAAFAMLMFSMAGCNTNAPATDETQPKATAAASATNAADAPDGSHSAESTDTSDFVPEPSQGENDLELITVPQDNTSGSGSVDNTQAATEPESETTVAETATEVQKIELPFVPAN